MMVRSSYALLTFCVIAACSVISFASDPDYCEAPTPLAVVPNPITSTLLQVFIISRHGDRSPETAIPHEHNDTRIVWNCTLRAPMRSLTSDKTLSSGTGVYFRYVDQSEGIFGNENSWIGNCQPGQLTDVGGEMCTRMGAGLRSIYVDKFHLLPDSLTKDDLKLLKLRTSDVQRTRESLASVLEGLYPADRRVGLYLPVDQLPYSVDILHPNTGNCPRISQLQNQNTVGSQEWMDQFAKIRSTIDAINEIAGTKHNPSFDTNHSAGGWCDIFHARQCHNLPLPCSKDGQTCVTDEMADKAFEFGGWGYCRTYAGDEMNRLTAGPVFMEVSSAFTDRISSNDSPRYIHYSAHDGTIAMILAALKYNCTFPPYASTIRFELWQTQDGPSPQYAVQIIYNNMVIRPPECSNDMCPLDDFQNMVSDRLTIRDKEKECAKQK